MRLKKYTTYIDITLAKNITIWLIFKKQYITFEASECSRSLSLAPIGWLERIIVRANPINRSLSNYTASGATWRLYRTQYNLR